MNIIIPLGSICERILENDYLQPKPLIKIFEKYIINYVIDNLYISKNDECFIIYNKNLDDYNFTQHINEKYPFINLIKIDHTKGAVETLYLGIEFILNNYTYNKKCLILDSDTKQPADAHPHTTRPI